MGYQPLYASRNRTNLTRRGPVSRIETRPPAEVEYHGANAIERQAAPKFVIPFAIGQEYRVTARITADDVARFAPLSGDDSPLHLDAAFARRHGRVMLRDRGTRAALPGISDDALRRDLEGATRLEALRNSF